MGTGRGASPLVTRAARASRGAVCALAALGALASVSCFKPNIEEGGFLCAADGKMSCPDGLRCGPDNRCYRTPPLVVDGGGDTAPVCTTAAVTPTCADGPAVGQACNPTCQTGCACGRCNVVGSKPTCVPPGTVPLGEVCMLGISDNCAPGLICLQEECGNALGRCYQFCTSNAQCMDATICQIPVDDANNKPTGFTTCDVPPHTCDPVSNTGCPNPALNCYLTSLGQTLCDCPSKSGQNDAPCTIYSDCAPMFVCVTGVGGETTAHCHFACAVASPACPTGTTCMPAATGASFGYCI
jgi:hypothetical protein